ncbi:MAG TPA: hypothetical protein VF009_01125 [Solirubrobacterales bacterium]
MTIRLPTRTLLTLLPLALLLALPAAAAAADTYDVSWNGGHIIATADGGFTEGTIESVAISFDKCGTSPEEVSCTWSATIALHSDPERRCDPTTPEDQTVWSSGPESGNGTVEGGPTSFPLEGCPGQSLYFRVEWEKSFEEGPEPPVMRITGGAFGGALLAFGSHPFVEPDRAIPTEYDSSYTLSPFEPNFRPKTFAPSPDCRAVQLESGRYAFAFGQMGCHRATNLGRLRYRTGRAPRGFVCRRLGDEGVRCWRRHEPAEFFEWHLPRRRAQT